MVRILETLYVYACLTSLVLSLVCRIPLESELINHSNAVAGHEARMRITEDGTLLVKKASQIEFDFYASLAHHPELSQYTPQYCGVMSSKHPQVETEPFHEIVLVNAAHVFKKPNVVDLKIGQKLWTKAYDDQKIKKFKDRAKKTTSHSQGFFIQGMGTWSNRLSPAGVSTTPTYKIADMKSFRYSVNNANIEEKLLQFFLAQGDQSQAGKIIKHLLKDLQGLERVLQTHNSRMIGSSILFIYEGDQVFPNEKITRSPPKPPVLKIIDFSHANWAPPKKGPDWNVLFGVRNLIKLLQKMQSNLRRRIA